MPPIQQFRLGYWLKLGWVSFGGPAQQISLMHQDVVERDCIITEAEFQQGLSFCMLLPGPEAQQLASYLGFRLGGWRGGVLAGLGFILPGLLVMGLLAGLYNSDPNARWVHALSALYPPILALSLLAGWNLARRSCRDGFGACLIGLGCIALGSQLLTLPGLMLLYGLIGLLHQLRGSRRKGPSHAAVVGSTIQFTPLASLMLTLGFVIAYALPLWLVSALAPASSPWWPLAWVSAEMATLSFGGAYVVLPLFIERAVHDYQWVSIDTLILALTFSELTPGPLVLVVCFVGYLVGASVESASEPALGGLFGLLLASYFLFLPSFAFILLGAPLVNSNWARTQLAGLFQGMGNAAIAGLITLLTSEVVTQASNPVTSAFNWSGAMALLSLYLLLRWPSARLCIVLSMGLLNWAITKLPW